MNRKLFTLAGFAMLAACGLAPATGNEAGAGAVTDGATASRRFDVAGVRLDMTAPQAVAALHKAGWNVKRDLGYDWAGHVEEEFRRQRNDLSFVEKTSDLGNLYADKGDEKLEVAVRPSPRGGAIETVRYRAPMAGRALQQTGSELVARYGRASTGSASANGFDLRWCVAARCDGSSSELTASAAGSNGQLVVALSWGADRHGAWDHEVAAAVATKARPAPRSF